MNIESSCKIIKRVYCSIELKDQREFVSNLFLGVVNDGPLEVKTTERVTEERGTEKGKMKENDKIDTDNRPIEIEETGIWLQRLSSSIGLWMKNMDDFTRSC